MKDYKLLINYHSVKKTEIKNKHRVNRLLNQKTGELLEDITIGSADYIFKLNFNFIDEKNIKTITHKMPLVKVYLTQSNNDWNDPNEEIVDNLLYVSIYGSPDTAFFVSRIPFDTDVQYYDEEILNAILETQDSKDWLIDVINNTNVKHDTDIKKYLLKNLLGKE